MASLITLNIMDNKVVVPNDFNELAIRRTGVVLKNGIAFDRSIRDMLAHAYTNGFVDCCEVSASEKKKLG